MAFLRPWAPFREMEDFRHTVDEMLEHLRGKIGYPLGGGSAALKPPIESPRPLGKDPTPAERAFARAWGALKRNAPDEAERVRKLSDATSGDSAISGLAVDGEGRRYCPRRELAGPLVGFVSSEDTDRPGGKRMVRGEQYHTDHSNYPAPPKATLLHAVTIPKSGGDRDL